MTLRAELDAVAADWQSREYDGVVQRAEQRTPAAGFALEYRTVYDAAANAAVSSLAAQVASSKSSPVLLRPQALMPNWFGIDLNVRSFGINANACANGARPRED